MMDGTALAPPAVADGQPKSRRSRGRPRLDRSPASIDRHIAERIRARRIATGKTQAHLADMLGVTGPAIQRQETGKCRISAVHLHAIARALGVPVGYFFQGLPGEGPAAAAAETGAVAEAARNLPAEAQRHLAAFLREIGEDR